jgi:hypothetical protein
MSSRRSLTRSQARSLRSMARLKIARSRFDRAISKRTRMDQTCFGPRGFFWPMSNPLFQGRWPRSTLRTSIEGPPPPRPPRRSIASVSFIPTERSGFPVSVLATGHFWGRNGAVGGFAHQFWQRRRQLRYVEISVTWPRVMPSVGTPY